MGMKQEKGNGTYEKQPHLQSFILKTVYALQSLTVAKATRQHFVFLSFARVDTEKALQTQHRKAKSTTWLSWQSKNIFSFLPTLIYCGGNASRAQACYHIAKYSTTGCTVSLLTGWITQPLSNSSSFSNTGTLSQQHIEIQEGSGNSSHFNWHWITTPVCIWGI